MDQKHKFCESRMPFPLRDIGKKSSQHVRACAAGDGAICSKNRKIGARLRSPSPIMAPGVTYNPRLATLLRRDARSWEVLGVVGSNLKMVRFFMQHF